MFRCYRVVIIMSKKNTNYINTSEAIQLASDMGIEINKLSFSYWCRKFPIGAIRENYFWKIDKEKFIKYLEERGANNMDNENTDLISTNEAIELASKMGIKISSRESLLYWCHNFPIGARKIGGQWKIDKEKFTTYLKGK
jgi:hypothetical protein